MKTIYLKDKVALITGAARGMGPACTRAFAAEGAKVAINYIYGGKLSAAVTNTLKEGGEALKPIVMFPTAMQSIPGSIKYCLNMVVLISFGVRN